MLNRRHIRIKVLQAIYAHHQENVLTLATEEANLIDSLESVYELYFYQLKLAEELLYEAIKERDELKNKHLPTAEDLKAQTNFTKNAVLNLLTNDETFQRKTTQLRTSWAANNDLVKKFFRKIKKSEEYDQYLKNVSPSFEQDREFVLWIYKFIIFNDEILESWYEELSIHWNDDIFVVNQEVLKTLKAVTEGKPFPVAELYKNEKDDKSFAIDLFRKTIINDEKYNEMILSKTKNWELERIATMDILLMKLAICEILEFESIPVKVTLNEYIEISKIFSTPKSNSFINGILDKLVADFKDQNLLKKSGRGLIDN